MTSLDDLPVTTQKSEEMLNSRQLEEYSEHRKELARWLLKTGKDPSKGKGYSEYTVKDTLYRLDQFNRLVWEAEGFTLSFTHEHADAYIDHRVLSDKEYSEADHSGVVKALKRYFNWRQDQYGGSEWECEKSFSSDEELNKPSFTRSQRRKLREAVLEYRDVPDYDEVTREKRDEINRHLAQRFGKAKNKITRKDWDRARSWKYPSLISVSLDAGLRPIEVKRANIDWVDFESGVLRIPPEDSSKVRDYWVCALRSDTVRRLKKWCEERKKRDEYNGSDKIWLTRHGNPYKSRTLKRVLRKICDEANIAQNQTVNWYMIRRSVATYLSSEMGIAAAADQMRHSNTDTTRRYIQTDPEDLRGGLEQMDEQNSEFGFSDSRNDSSNW